MEDNTSALLLRIYLSSTDKYKEELLYEHIVFEAKENGVAGATVVKGILGYGTSSVIHSYKFWEVSEKLPVVIEMIDSEKKVTDFLEYIKPVLESVRYGCLVTTEKTDILLYKTGVKHPVK
jgi:PII-like signaling protein